MAEAATSTPSAFDSLRNRLSKASRNWWGDTLTPVEQEIAAETGKAKAKADGLRQTLSNTRASTDARSAYAAGVASSQRKVFKRQNANAFQSIGKLEKANTEATTNADAEVAQWEGLKNKPNLQKSAAQSFTTSLGPMISIW